MVLCLDIKTIDQIVEGIRIIENSKRIPFGIESIPLKGKTQKQRTEYAKKICFNSVNNNFNRWIKAGKPGEFFVFMNKRYCPLDNNWSVNLRSVLKKRGFDFRKVK